MNKYIWTFVGLAACLDVCFCYELRDSMLEWESNPLARWAFRSQGLSGVIVYRIFWLAFAVAMSRTRTSWSWLVAPTWGVAHAYLLVTLLLVGPYVSTLRAGTIKASAVPVKAAGRASFSLADQPCKPSLHQDCGLEQPLADPSEQNPAPSDVRHGNLEPRGARAAAI
jgi:hypothetical protein